MFKIINFINFLRGVEPRCQIDLFEPVVRQLELAQKYDFPVTWLLQYDALEDHRYAELLKTAQGNHEFGVWLEFVQPQVERAGLKWRGRFPWDWHVDTGFSIGYTPTERERLVDVLFDKFREIFGYYPRVFGSWLFDAHLLAYMEDKYCIDGACNCRDQWGTDGYSLWGGYWNGAYYPNRRNAYLPAISPRNTLKTPVFRMLVSDPIYQYDAGLSEGRADWQPVVTLEPAPVTGGNFGGGGSNAAWIDWFFDETFGPKALEPAYAQAGQENSFGWAAMSGGLSAQCKSVSTRRDAGELEVLTLGETARRFRRDYPSTPVTLATAFGDWRGTARSSLWYSCRSGRLNFITEERGELRLRDWHMWHDDWSEPFLEHACPEHACVYDAPALQDGLRWSAPSQIAGWRFYAGKQPLCGRFENLKKSGETVDFDFNSLHFTLHNSRLAMTGCGSIIDLRLVFSYSPDRLTDTVIRLVAADCLEYRYRDGSTCKLRLFGATAHEIASGSIEITVCRDRAIFEPSFLH